MANLASTYKKAGIKGMGETNGGSKVITPSMKHKSTYSILPRLDGETVADWIQRCKNQ